MRRHILIGLAVGLAVLALGLLAYQWSSMPTTLRIAVGPTPSEDAHLVLAAAQYLARERESTRLKPVLTDGAAASAEALKQGKADLAVVRTDVDLPTNAQTVAILHRDAAILLTTEQRGIKEVSDLAGRTIGVFRRQPANVKLLERILEHYEIAAADVTVVAVDAVEDIERLIDTKQIDAVLVIGPPTGRTVADAVAAVTQAGKGPPVFVSVGEAADAVAQRIPTIEAIELGRGAFGGSPPRPADVTKTLSVSHRLVADAKLGDDVVSELSRLLFTMRPALATDVPLANRIEQPDTSKSSSLPVHPGAAAYYDGEVLTFMERYGDWVYLVIMAGSIVGSAVAGLAGAASARMRTRTAGLLDELVAIMGLARQAEHEAELESLETQAEQVLAQALARASDDGLDQAVMIAIFLGLEQARRAIAARRRRLLETAPLRHAAE